MVRIVGDVTVEEGRVVKDAVAIVGSVTVLSGGRVMGNAVAIGGGVHLKANARVEGDTVSIGGEILKEEGPASAGMMSPLERGQTSSPGNESARYPFWFLSGEPPAAYPDGVAHSGVGHLLLLSCQACKLSPRRSGNLLQKWGWGLGALS
jgi:hypothetical protein